MMKKKLEFVGKINGRCVNRKHFALTNWLTVIAGFFVFTLRGFGTTYYANSPSAVDVQNAINVTQNGDTVIVPSGSATWSSTVTINDSITLIGGGNTNGNTSITQGSSWDNRILMVNAPSTVEDFNWTEVNGAAGDAPSFIAFSIPSSSGLERFCSNNVNCVAGVSWYGTDIGTGLFDHNNVLFNNNALNIYGSGNGSNAWLYGTTYGTTNQYLFIEHNVFNTGSTNSSAPPDGLLDAYAGANFVLRYNTMTNCNWGWHGCDSGSYRSTHAYEIYGNTDVFFGTYAPYWYCIFNSRGGTGLIWSNSFPGWGPNQTTFLIQYFRISYYVNITWPEFPADIDGWISGETPTGYQGLDQQGFTGPTTFYSTHSTQVSSPTYIWGNSPGFAAHVGADNSATLLGRDWFTNAPPFAYTPLQDPYPLGGAVGTKQATNPPQITAQPANVAVSVGQPATFNVTATGTAPLYYQWYLNSSAIANATGSSYTIASAQTNNMGNYMAIVTNNFGKMSSSQASLTVTAQPPQTVHYYYVATNGSDSGSGSISSPWATVDHATSMMSGGDVLYIRGGVYSQIFDIYGPSGSPAYPTTVTAYPGETPIFNANSLGGGSHSLDGLNWFILNGLTIISNNIGIIVGYASGCTNVTLANMTITDIGQQGLQVEHNSDNVLIISNTVDNTGLWIYNGEGLYLGEGDSPGIMDNTHNVSVEDCLIYNTKDEGVELKPGTYNMTVSNCVIYSSNIEQDQYGAGGGAIEVDEEGTYNYYTGDPNQLVCNNIVYDTPIGIRAGNGGEFFNNVVYSVTGNGILANNNDGDSYSRYIYNNTVDAPSSIALINNGATASILNNIGPTGTDNLVTSSAYFVNEAAHNYNLVTNSAPIKAGANLYSMVQTDFNGNPRPSTGAFDIGAFQFESVSGSAPLPPTNLRATGLP